MNSSSNNKVPLILSEATTLIRARDLRSSGRRGKGPLDTANLIGTLLLRSAERSERIYRAMLARGFTGVLPLERMQRFTQRDIWFATLTFSTFLLQRFIL